MIPAARPRLTLADLQKRLAKQHPQHYPGGRLPAFLVVGIRGYYRDSMGAPGRNDRAIYDDAIILVTDRVFASFNGNTDPSAYRAATAARKGMASLRPGVWPCYRFDTHGGSVPHPAICQRAAVVTVDRDGSGPDTGMFGINIHRGGNRGTSSEGCQTLPPAQWEAFYQLAEAEAKRLFGTRWRRETITYVLLDGWD